MKNYYRALAVFLAISISATVSLCGCAVVTEGLKETIGISTRSIENARRSAVTKTFEMDYATCYSKTETILANTPLVSFYIKDPKRQMIALYYVDVNTTSVGVFFTQMEPGKTRVEISSESSHVKDLMAKIVFTKLQAPAPSAIPTSS